MPQNNPDEGAIRLLLKRPIAFHVVFARIAGNTTAGVFLSQLWYWHDRGKDPDGWIYKTQAEWYDETCLTRYEQESARKSLREKGILEEKREGLPALLYYRINLETFFRAVNEMANIMAEEERTRSENQVCGKTTNKVAPQPSMWENHILECGKPTNRNAEKPQTTRAQILTAETTTESTTEEARAPEPKTFPRPEPRLTNYVAHLLWRIELSDGALMTSRAASRNARIALELLGVAAEDRIVSAYEWRKRNAREGVVYEFRFLADDFNSTLAAMAAKPRAKRAADKTLQDLAAEIGDDVDNLRAKGMLPTREQIRAGYYDAGKKQSW